MHYLDYSHQSEDFQRIEKTIRFIEANFKSQPALEQIAAIVHSSKYHFGRLFKRWAGISPIQFLQFMTSITPSGGWPNQRAFWTHLWTPACQVPAVSTIYLSPSRP